MNPAIFANIKIELRVDNPLNPLLDESCFKLVQIFGDKITFIHFSFYIWNEQLITAMKHFVTTCTDLEEIGILYSETTPLNVDILKDVLRPLFEDQTRASKIRRLSLGGNFNPEFITLVMVNCVN